MVRGEKVKESVTEVVPEESLPPRFGKYIFACFFSFFIVSLLLVVLDSIICPIRNLDFFKSILLNTFFFSLGYLLGANIRTSTII
jgi:hypothetical protein